MQKIQLTRNEKRLLRNIAAGVDYWPAGMSDETISCAASELERHDLIRAAWTSGQILVDAALTNFGSSYIVNNPHLWNPIDWKWIITTIIAVGTLTVAVIALLTACKAIQQ